jgi:uncharacterized membrane protein
VRLPSGVLDPLWVSAGWGVFGAAVAYYAAEFAKRWRGCRLQEIAGEGLFNAWLGCVVSLALLWQMEITAERGLVLHLSGAALAVAMFRVPAALLALCLALAATTANGHGEWSMFGPNAVLVALLPVWLMAGWMDLVRRFLPKHMFVFIFGNGFFGAAVVMLIVGVLLSVLLALAGVASFDHWRHAWLPYVLLLSFSEASLSGMVLTLLVVYRPEWVATFDDREYLRRR